MQILKEGIMRLFKVKIFHIVSLKVNHSMLLIVSKVTFVEKTQTSDNNQFIPTEQEISEVPRNTTMHSIQQSSEDVDKKMKQIQYVKELEEQIKIRDKIKNEEEQRRIRKLGAYQPDIDEFKLKLQTIPIEQDNIVDHTQNSPTIPTSSKDRRSLASAPKVLESVAIGYTAESDPFGGNIPIRKKIANRIDQELESRGSIFSGRDEKSVLSNKRNIEQQHMREELLRQIEEKKKREEAIKKKKMDEDIKEELKIKQELQQFETEVDGFNSSYKQENLNLQRQVSAPPASYLPELTNRQSEPKKSPQKVYDEIEMAKHKSVENNFETTAAFANYTTNNQQKEMQNEYAQKQNKIKEMIDQ